MNFVTKKVIKLIEFNKTTLESLKWYEVFVIANFMVFDFPWQWQLIKSWYEKFY